MPLAFTFGTAVACLFGVGFRGRLGAVSVPHFFPRHRG